MSACSSDKKATKSCKLRPSDRPGHDHVEFPSGSIPAQLVERRPLVAALGAADPVILVDLEDIAAHAAGDLVQFAFLIGRGLVLRADTKVENGAFH